MRVSTTRRCDAFLRRSPGSSVDLKRGIREEKSCMTGLVFVDRNVFVYARDTMPS